MAQTPHLRVQPAAHPEHCAQRLPLKLASPGLSTGTVVLLLEALPSKPRRPNHVSSKSPLPPAHPSKGHKIPQQSLCMSVFTSAYKPLEIKDDTFLL